MRQARYKILPDDGTYYGEIPGFQGVFSNADTLEECRDVLEELLGEWILLRVADGLTLPVAGTVELALRKAA
jgi:predicted RNase H-like HicB family nuclease